MKGTGNNFTTISRKLIFMLLPTCGMRNNFIIKRKSMFKHIGVNIMWQPRYFPADPEFISIGDNVKIAAGVRFINHDINYAMLNTKYNVNYFKINQGCIKIGNNVMIGANVIILPDVYIQDNCIIGAGSIVTRDIPSNSIAAGVPCKVIGKFDDFVAKAQNSSYYNNPELYWTDFENRRMSIG